MNPTLRAIVLAFSLLLIAIHPIILNSVMTLNPATDSNYQTAYFAGGCFWCMEPVFDSIEGVTDTISGYMGGTAQTANYSDVSAGITRHKESIQVVYDPTTVDYATLLNAFWRSIDPTDPNGQFADQAPHYQTAIFYQSDHEQQLAQQSKDALIELNKFSNPIVTEIIPATEFFPAEEYHQNYYKKNTMHYNAYKIGSGRAGFLNQLWGNND